MGVDGEKREKIGIERHFGRTGDIVTLTVAVSPGPQPHLVNYQHLVRASNIMMKMGKLFTHRKERDSKSQNSQPQRFLAC